MAHHRRLWMAGRGTLSWPLWMARELFGWLRWTLWFGWRSALATVAARGPAVLSKEGISIAHQRRIALRLALGWGIAGYETYRFQLYRNPRKALDYIYDCETNAFHTLRSGPGRAASAAAALLRDKVATFDRLTAAGVPMTPTRMLVPRGDTTSVADVMATGSVFCKTRMGHGGIGAFAAWPEPGGAAGRSFDGTTLRDIAAVDAAWRRLLVIDDALVQPLLVDHRDLARLSGGGALTTIRYITGTDGDDVWCLSAVLEVPVSDDGARQARHAILPIHIADGAILPPPTHVDTGWRDIANVTFARAPDITHVPHWQTIVAASAIAHRTVGALWAIAWDWAITPSGPIMLEGNAGWALAVPQLLNGPLATSE